MMYVIQLAHPSDPRFLVVDDPPPSIAVADLGNWTYGKPLTYAPAPVNFLYEQPGGFGTPWVRPDAWEKLAPLLAGMS